MDTKEIVTAVIDAFDNNDVELILSYLTEDAEWHMVGDQTYAGKETIREFFTTHPDMKMISSTRENIIVEGNTAAVNGEVQCEEESSGAKHEMYYCDLYVLEGDLVKKMTSYVLPKK
jgi:ketosteroid isomerase-like protein